ncbi:MAG TPA: SDR family NAD(P)-dependent oxidoreductase [Terriglobales bacterium]|nr:SDR family NAD(P)-dependent oxidoreductase [Terriglobales bacterium]
MPSENHRSPVDLSGKSALVTGGARGIGRAIVEALAQAGADVAILDFRLPEAQAAARDIAQATGRQVIAVQADVMRLDEVQQAVAEAIQRLGKLDILVNNAGWDRLMPFLKTTPDLWERVIGVNYRGVIHTCYAVLPHMKERKQGSIVNVSSDSARVGSLGEAIYAGSKAAVIAFSKTLAREHARDNIRINIVCPGLAETPLLEEMQQDEFTKKILGAVVNAIPLKRLGKPEEIAPMVLFFASEAARYVTGQVVSVNGGLTMAG